MVYSVVFFPGQLVLLINPPLGTQYSPETRPYATQSFEKAQKIFCHLVVQGNSDNGFFPNVNNCEKELIGSRAVNRE